MVMVLDWKTNLAKSNERLFSLPAIFLQWPCYRTNRPVKLVTKSRQTLPTGWTVK